MQLRGTARRGAGFSACRRTATVSVCSRLRENNMRVIRDAELPMVERKETQREGRFIEKTFIQGEPGTPDNFKFYMVQQFGDFYSPRHKHNFEQVRLQLAGTTSYDKDGVMKPGVLAYFPEGTPYGPTTIKSEESLIVILQAGGPSRSGYASAAERETANRELRRTGEFRNGVYFPNPGTGRKNQDAFEACWEFINKRELEYPEPRFQRPVFMNTESFPWRPLADARGVAEKQLGGFELGFGMRYLRIDPGANVTVNGRAICYVLAGGGTADGAAYGKGDVIYADAAETATVKASATTELFTLSMLMLAADRVPRGATAAA
jgi:hypothetical protein